MTDQRDTPDTRESWFRASADDIASALRWVRSRLVMLLYGDRSARVYVTMKESTPTPTAEETR